MIENVRSSRLYLALFLFLCLCAGCAHLPQYALPGPSPTPNSSPTSSSSASPQPCGTPATNSTAFIVISVTVLPSTDPTFGPVNGYVQANPDGTFGLTASIINLHASDVVQFVNVDDYGASVPIYHSGVGFSGTGFPSVPFAFPAGTAAALGTSISSSVWSTGRLGAIETVCYSQTLTLIPGTYFFGDNSLSSLRDIMVVESGTSELRRKTHSIILGR